MYSTHIIIWHNAHSGTTPPVELVNTIIECNSPEDALVKVKDIKDATPTANECWFYMKDYWNNNTKQQFCHYS